MGQTAAQLFIRGVVRVHSQRIDFLGTCLGGGRSGVNLLARTGLKRRRAEHYGVDARCRPTVHLEGSYRSTFLSTCPGGDWAHGIREVPKNSTFWVRAFVVIGWV